MEIRLNARDGHGCMSPERIVARLRGEFSYVESVEYPYDFQKDPLHVYFGDDPGTESKIMGAAIKPGPGGSLVVSCSSDARPESPERLLRRSAAALGYEIADEQIPSASHWVSAFFGVPTLSAANA